MTKASIQKSRPNKDQKPSQLLRRVRRSIYKYRPKYKSSRPASRHFYKVTKQAKKKKFLPLYYKPRVLDREPKKRCTSKSTISSHSNKQKKEDKTEIASTTSGSETKSPRDARKSDARKSDAETDASKSPGYEDVELRRKSRVHHSVPNRESRPKKHPVKQSSYEEVEYIKPRASKKSSATSTRFSKRPTRSKSDTVKSAISSERTRKDSSRERTRKDSSRESTRKDSNGERTRKDSSGERTRKDSSRDDKINKMCKSKISRSNASENIKRKIKAKMHLSNVKLRNKLQTKAKIDNIRKKKQSACDSKKKTLSKSAGHMLKKGVNDFVNKILTRSKVTNVKNNKAAELKKKHLLRKKIKEHSKVKVRVTPTTRTTTTTVDNKRRVRVNSIIDKPIGKVSCSKDKWVLTLDFSKMAVRQVKVYIADKKVEVRGLYRTQRKVWKNINENYTIPDHYPCVVHNTKNGVWTIVARDCKGKCAWHRPEWPFPNGFKWPWEGRPNWPFENIGS